jgi:hypothetical protein
MTGQLQFEMPAVAGTVDPAAGERAKARGMALAEAATDVSWADACDAAIRVMAARRVPFQASDMVAEGLVDEPDDHHRWGPRFGAAARRGWITEYAIGKSKRRDTHRSRLVVWIGTDAGDVAA